MTDTFTYRHSELPLVRPEIKAQIVALDCCIADLILKSQGNYRELQHLQEVLDDGLSNCELNLNTIRIIADDDQQPSTVSMKDLPLEEKRLIYSCSRTNSILLNIVSQITGKSPETLAEEIALQAAIHDHKPTNSEIEDFVDGLAPWAKKAAERANSKSNYLYRKL